MRAVRLVALAIVLLLPSGALSQETGFVTGSVVDERSAPLPGATVLYYRVPETEQDARGRLRVAGRFFSGKVEATLTAAFTIGGLPPGTYHLCAAGTQRSQLPSCRWGGSYARVRISSAATATAGVLTVRAGTFVAFQVSDPNDRLRSGGKLFIGVMSAAGHYHRAQLVSRDGTTYTYGVAVPKNSSLSLIVSTDLNITNQSGTSLASGVPSTLIRVGDESEVNVQLMVN